MKQNERAVSPVIGVMLMIVVTIIVAAVVSAFAGSTDLAKRTGPSVTLDSQVMYSTEPKYTGTVSWTTTSENNQYYPEIDCTNAAVGSDEDYYCYEDPNFVANYCNNDEWNCVWPGGYWTATTLSSNSQNVTSNKDGLLFTHTGGDPIDLKNLELTVRYYNLASTVYYSDTKNQVPPMTGDISNLTGNADDYEILSHYFVKVNRTSRDDTIIRSGDQFMFLVDHSTGAYGGVTPHLVWALASTRNDNANHLGASIAFDTQTGEAEWWLTDSPSGNTLAHAMFEFPNS